MLRPLRILWMCLLLSGFNSLFGSNNTITFTSTPTDSLKQYESKATDEFLFILWNFGVKGGYNNSKYHLFRSQYYRGDYKGNSGFDIGAFFEVTFAEKPFSLQIETLYSETSLTVNRLFKDELREIDLELQLFRVPLSMKYAFLKGNVNPFISAGPNLGLIVGSKAKIFNNGEDFRSEMVINKAAIGMQLSTGVNFQVSRKVQIQSELRWMLSNINLQDRVSGLQLSLGVRFLEWF